VVKEHPFAKLLATDARIRGGKAMSARELFLSIKMQDIPPEHHNSYAVVAGHLALSCEDEGTRLLAISSLSKISSTRRASEYAEQLLRDLQNRKFGDFTPRN
jgi:hypothetical protein